MRKRRAKKKEVDVRYFSWPEYVGVFLGIGTLAALPAFMYGGITVRQAWREYLIWYVIYWAIISALFCTLTAYMKYRKFEKPMHALSEAARRVANGDFSVYLPPVHTLGAKDYIDVMFQDFNKMVEELASTETMKTDFIATVSHEIKTPVSIIQNYATALQKPGVTDAARNEYADTIATASEQLAIMVTNILRLNKIENQVIVPRAEPYNLCRQLSDCALSFVDVCERKNIEFVIDVEDRATILADEEMMLIVWNNLLSNAFKFTEPGGRVILRQTSSANSVSVTVSDTGCGMAAETQRHAFDKFYQGDASHSQEGNGLGLALCHRIVALMGGQISIHSRLNEGSTFSVELKTE